jgi:hypothetical protein
VFAGRQAQAQVGFDRGFFEGSRLACLQAIVSWIQPEDALVEGADLSAAEGLANQIQALLPEFPSI